MFKEEKLPVAAQSVAPAEPKPPREIHLWIDRPAKELRVDPKGTLEAGAQMEIINTIGFPLRGGARDIVLKATAICEKHGWQQVDGWLDGEQGLHVKMQKPAD